MLKKVGNFFKRFCIWIICTLLSFFLFTFVFITVIHIDVGQITENIYTNSNDAAHQKITSLLTNLCVTLNYESVDPKKIQDERLRKAHDICIDFNAKTQSDAEIFQRAVALFAGEINNAGFQEDIEEKVKHQYIGGIGDSNEFTSILDTYKQLRKMVIPFLTFLIIFFFVILYLFFLRQPLEYMRRSGRIFLKVSLFYLIPFLLLHAYLFFNPLDTTPIINNFLSNLDQENNSIAPESMIEPVVILVLLTIYSFRIFVISLIMLFIAILMMGFLPRYLDKKVVS
ncbi:hypothetical protein HZA96_00750 [Candidatus Woesearchaeota archaeon]|nr:hypothetical protein [Candidatus Woesearchaeota archaeon]